MPPVAWLEQHRRGSVSPPGRGAVNESTSEGDKINGQRADVAAGKVPGADRHRDELAELYQQLLDDTGSGAEVGHASCTFHLPHESSCALARSTIWLVLPMTQTRTSRSPPHWPARSASTGRTEQTSMRLTLATEPGTPGWPNEDFAAAAPGAAVLLDGATQRLRAADSGCVHGVAWYARTLGAELLARITAEPPVPLSGALGDAIAAVRTRHEHTCDLANPATPRPR